MNLKPPTLETNALPLDVLAGYSVADCTTVLYINMSFRFSHIDNDLEVYACSYTYTLNYVLQHDCIMLSIIYRKDRLFPWKNFELNIKKMRIIIRAILFCFLKS